MKDNIKVNDRILWTIFPFFLLCTNLDVIITILSPFKITSSLRTFVAVLVYVVIDCIMLFFFFKNLRKSEKKHKDLLLIAGIIALIYAGPLFWNLKTEGFVAFVKLIQYFLFVGPVFFMGIQLASDKNGIKKCLDAFKPYEFILSVGGVIYIAVLFVATQGAFSIGNLSYGYIAYMFLTGMFFCIARAFFYDRFSTVVWLKIVVFWIAINYTGTRSAFLCGCIFFIGVGVFVVAKGKCNNRGTVKKYLILLCVAVIITLGCKAIVPEGARLNVVNQDFIYELSSDQEAHETFVWDVQSHTKKNINEFYLNYIINSSLKQSESTKKLHNDIKNEKYCIIKPVESKDKKYCETYTVHWQRINLYKAAFKEFQKHPIIGNGALYFVNKYDGIFPHNVILECLADYGALGTICFVGFILLEVVAVCKIIIRTKNSALLLFLIILLSYIPMYLLYTSLYSNSFLIFTLLSLTLIIKVEQQNRCVLNERFLNWK